jgi:hypothetical protein
MKIKLQTALDALPALQALAAVPMPAVGAFKVGMVLRKLRDPLTEYDAKRTALLKEIGVPIPLLDKDGKPVLGPDNVPRMREGEYNVPEEHRERWAKEIADMGAAELDLPVSAVKVAELGAASVEPRVLAMLDWCMEE